MIKQLLIFIGAILVVIGALGWVLSPQDELQETDAIVVISGDRGFRYREALNLFEAGYADTIIFSGAARDPASPSNAAVMRDSAIDDGVPATAIKIEEDSYSTRENARNVARIVVDDTIDSIILVTSPFHQRRAHLEFAWALENYDVEIINNPATNDSSWQRTLWWVSPQGWYYTLSETAKVSLTLLQRVVGATGEPIL